MKYFDLNTLALAFTVASCLLAIFGGWIVYANRKSRAKKKTK